jgi:hypothetical protein
VPLEDFSSHDPDFSAEQVAQCARIIDGLRAINTKVVRLSGSVGELAAIADGIESLSASLDAVTKRRAMETFRFRFDTAEPNGVMPFNPATGAFNPIAPKLEMRVENGKLVTEFAFASHYESSPDLGGPFAAESTVRGRSIFAWVGFGTWFGPKRKGSGSPALRT